MKHHQLVIPAKAGIQYCNPDGEAIVSYTDREIIRSLKNIVMANAMG